MLTNQSSRINFASTKHVPDYPDFLDIQVKSFQDFFQMETKSDAEVARGYIAPSRRIFLSPTPATSLYWSSWTIS